MFQHLTEDGQQQAIKIGSFLQSTGINISSIHTSTLTRARETTALITRCVNINASESDLLREIPMCIVFGKITVSAVRYSECNHEGNVYSQSTMRRKQQKHLNFTSTGW
jgi:bisphosphoglycerate-dependent phosphoglycerate mutase